MLKNILNTSSVKRYIILVMLATVFSQSVYAATIKQRAADFFWKLIAHVAIEIVTEKGKEYLEGKNSQHVEPGTSADYRRIQNIILGTLDSKTPLSERIGYYAYKVDYFNAGVVDRKFIKKDRRRFEKHWHHIEYKLLSIDEIAVDSNEALASVRYTIAFEVQRPGKRKTGTSQVAILIGDFYGQPRIYAIKEWVTHH
jgi:hypothetical protein